MSPYTVSYEFEGREYGLTPWAHSPEECERRIKAIWTSADVLGPQEVEVPVRDARPLIQAAPDRRHLGCGSLYRAAVIDSREQAASASPRS